MKGECDKRRTLMRNDFILQLTMIPKKTLDVTN